jgi:class 3 adenylate cyclase
MELTDQMLRLSYISKYAHQLGPLDLANIEVVSKHNNAKRGIRGVLLCFGNMFFQTLEGEKDQVMPLFDEIREDDRHSQVTLLDIEHGVEQREFEDWSMKVIDLDESTEPVMRPVRHMLSQLVSTFKRLDQSHNVLETYTPASVITMLNDGKKPLEEPLKSVEKMVLFTDLVAFSTMSSMMDAKQVIQLLNRFAEIVIDCVEAQGGEVGKLIGDGVMAYFEGDQADAAIQASLNILKMLKQERDLAPTDDLRRALYGGIGLASGEVVQGNMGSSRRLDYTIIGDSVNRAALLEKMTRNYDKALILSEEVKQKAKLSWDFTDLGMLNSKKLDQNIPMFTMDEPSVHEMISRAAIVSLLKKSKGQLKATV